MGQRFRAGVAMVVRHPQTAEVLAFERADLPGQWQLPQGGLDDGEEPRAAAWRELAEETGLTAADVCLVAEHPRWVVYEWPPELRDRRRGQAQRWFVFVLRDGSRRPDPDGREFRAWRWCSAAWLVEHVVEFRRAAYAEVLAALADPSLPSGG